MSAVASGSAAKPLLTSSEMTYARACLEFDDSYDRLVQICELALAETDAGRQQRLTMLENLGSALLNLDRLDEAEKRYREILADDPSSVAGLNGLGWVFRARDAYEQALAMFRKSTEQSPSAEALAGMGSMLIRSGQGSFEDGMRYLDAALAIDPGYRWAMREKGWRHSDADNFAEAETAFRAVLELDERDVNALAGLAQALGEQGQHDAAFEIINRAITSDPDDFWLYERRAIILYELKRYRQSEREADLLLERWPDHAGAHVRKARALEALGKRKAALNVLSGAQDRLGFDDFVGYWQADMLASEERYDDAETVLNRVIDQGAPDRSDYELLAYVRLESGKWDQARQAIEIGLKIDPKAEWLVYYDALSLLNARKPDEAMERFAQAISLGLPDDRIGYFAGEMVGAGFIARALVLRGRLLTQE
jgi:tetratricopeptide (TPR) repeat protein